MPGTLYTSGSQGLGTVAELEDWDTIQYSADEPLTEVQLVVTDGGALDLTEELQSTVDADNDGAYDDRGAVVYASTYGNTITTGSGDDTLYGSHGDDTLNGGAGKDTASYAEQAADLQVRLNTSQAQRTGAGNDAHLDRKPDRRQRQ